MVLHDFKFIFSSFVLKTWELTYSEDELLSEHHFFDLDDEIFF